MKQIALVYHSAHGHTEHFAQHVVAGAQNVPGVNIHLLKADTVAGTPDMLIDFDGFIWGSPTYLGGVSGTFKSFMDSTGRLWRQQQLRGKLASGFTVSSLPAGDKQSTLLSMLTFSMQHGMLWIGNPILPEQHAGVPYEEAANRLGSWTGAMAQAGHASAANSLAPGDLKTARLFGENFSAAITRLCPHAAHWGAPS